MGTVVLNKPLLCSGCPLYTKGQGFAPPEGSPNAELWLIGEALGEEEAITGRPFVGGAGRVLNALLASAGISRNSCYISNVVKCRPVTPEGKNRTPNPDEILTCTRRYLNDEIANAPLTTTIVPLGNVPLKAITGKDSITKWRGSTLRVNGRLVVPTIHPANIMRQQKMWSVVVFDLRKAAHPPLPDPTINFIIQPTFETVVQWLTANKEADWLVIDIETSIDQVWNVALICIGFCNGTESLCVPWLYEGGKEYWPTSLQPIIIELVNETLKGSNLVYQNSPFDVRVLRSIGFEINLQPRFDTMFAHHLMFAELPHKLEFITSVYTNIPYYKSDVKDGTEPKSPTNLLTKDDSTWNYNCLDTSVTYIAGRRLAEELVESGLSRFFIERTMPMIPVVIEMMDLGIGVDINKAKDISTELGKYLSSQQIKLDNLAGETINPLSNQQLANYFFKKKGFKIIRRTETGAPSCDEEVLERLFSQYGATLAYEIIQYRKAAKIKSTYLDVEGQLGLDGRLHTTFKLHGTATGRLSSKEPNLQNIPKAIREIYIPAESKEFWQFDFSQIEVRVISYLCGDEIWLTAFYDPTRDLHAENAALLFNKPVIECGKNTVYRDAAKTFVYGCILYGGSAYSFMSAWPGLFQQVKAVELAQDRLLTAHPKLAAYRESIQRQLKQSRTLFNAFGRPRKFFGTESQIVKAGYNFPVQSTAADIINPAMVRLYKLGVPGMLLQVHDSILFEWTAPEVEQWAAIVKTEMERPVIINSYDVVIPVDVAHGANWKEAS